MQLYSFNELGKVLYNLAPRQKREKKYFCRKCGAQLKRVGNSNVYLCDHADDNGKVCTGRYIVPVRAS